MHPRLLEFLQKSGLNADTTPHTPQQWHIFLQHINTALQQADNADASPLAHLPQSQQEVVHIIAERDKLRSVLSSISMGLCLFGREAQLLFINPAARQYLQMAEATVDTQAVLSRLRISDQWQPNCYLEPEGVQRMIAEGSSLTEASAFLRRDGLEDLSIACCLYPISKGVRVSGAVLLFRDTSEQQKVAAALLAAKESAEKASAAKSDFLSSMSHELRTPMNAILGYGEILQEDLGDPSNEHDPDYFEDLLVYVDNILQAGRNLLGLINEVLDLTKIESGKIELQITKSDLLEVSKQCIEKLRPQLAEKNLQLDLTQLPSQPVYALADAKRIKQVFSQLLSNAVKHNKEQGSIQVRIEQPSIETVRLVVADTGVGMSEAQQAQIFKPFTRISGRNLSKGTGVGLTIAKQLLDIMGGHIGLKSQLDLGSTFWIELPTGETAETEKSNSPGTDRKYLLLYIEDSRTNVSLMGKILQDRPEIAFISAPTGEMGLELARAHRPDIILLDINLPGISGFEVLERLRTVTGTRDIPVIGLSADDSKEALAQAKTVGFIHYMIKPLKKAQFLQALDKLAKPEKTPIA